MIKFLNRHLAFDRNTRRRFMIRLDILFENKIPSMEMLNFIEENTKDKPVKKLMQSAIAQQSNGKPWAAHWAEDGYFTEEEALRLTEAQSRNENDGFRLALKQLIEDDAVTVTFWMGIFKTRMLHLLISVFVCGLFYYMTQVERAKFATPFEALGGDVSEIFLMQVGDFISGPLIILLGVWIVFLMGYRRVRENVQTEYAREPFKKLGFFKIYDLIFEYRVISTITSFLQLGTNTQGILDSLQQIYKSPYQRARIGDLISGVQHESKKLIDSLEGSIVTEPTHRLLTMAAPKNDPEVLAKAFDLTRQELQQHLLGIYARLANIPLLITVLLVAAMILGILDLNTSIQEALQQAEEKALTR